MGSMWLTFFLILLWLVPLQKGRAPRHRLRVGYPSLSRRILPCYQHDEAHAEDEAEVPAGRRKRDFADLLTSKRE